MHYVPSAALSSSYLGTPIIVLAYYKTGVIINPTLRMVKLRNRNIKNLAPKSHS